MCRFIESIKLVDGVFYRLEYHQKRVQSAFDIFYPNSQVINIKHELEKIQIPPVGVFKCRVVYADEILLIEYVPYIRRAINSLQMIETDIEPLVYKVEDRTKYNEAFAKRNNSDDVLMLKNGLLTDTSYCNIALYNGTIWFTPKTPLLYGTNRAQLLANNILIEKDISYDEVNDYQKIALFNAMIEFGELVLDVKQIIQ